MAFLESYLFLALYRYTCPDSIELGEYQLGMLAGESKRRVEWHLRSCPRCQEEVQQLQTYLDSLAGDLEIPFSSRLKTWVARLLPADAFGRGLTPAFGVRGNTGQVIAYQAGEAQLSLFVQEDPTQPDRRSVLGLLIGVPPEEVQVSLFMKGRQLQTAPVDDLGNFVLSAIKKGEYELVLRGSTFEIDASPLVIE